MVNPTPWQANNSSRKTIELPYRQAYSAGYRRSVDTDYYRTRRPVPNRLDLRADWGYVGAAVLSLLTFVFLFQPWVTASGQNGRVSVNGFGEVDGFTRGAGNTGLNTMIDNTGIDGLNGVTVSGFWAVLASIAALTTVFAVVTYLRVRSDTLSYVVIGASAAVAFFVLIELLYLNSKVPDIRSLTVASQGGGLTRLLQFVTGKGGDAPSAQVISSGGLTLGAMLGGAAAFGAVLSAAATGLRKLAAARQLMWPTGRVRYDEPAADDFAWSTMTVDQPKLESGQAANADDGELVWVGVRR